MVFRRFAILSSGTSLKVMTTRYRSSGNREMISFTARFWALVSFASANDGVKIVIGDRGGTVHLILVADFTGREWQRRDYTDAERAFAAGAVGIRFMRFHIRTC